MKNSQLTLFSKFSGCLLLAAAVFLFLPLTNVKAADAIEVWPTITTSNGAVVNAVGLSDEGYSTEAVFAQGDTITLTSDTAMGSLYICWNNKNVAAWSLTLEDGSTQECGQHGYLHEYVPLNVPSKTVTLHIGADDTRIVKLIVLSEGDRPASIQDWGEACDKADILLVSTHADDEQIFFGGILPYYAGELGLKVQVVYFTNYWTPGAATVREHEKLDGLWTVGVRNYPLNGDFEDVYSTDLDTAKSQYDYDAAVGFMVQIFRRFQPLVVVGQDLNGEYGHGGHRLTAAAIADAVQVSMNADSYPESAEEYGVYDVPKTYLHLYSENQIDLDCQRSLTHFDGKTVLEVAKEGYLQHRSQQWCWFYVDDEYEYDCGKYGLYRSTVGNDTEADLLCNLTTYEEQAEIAAEESRAAAESEAASIAESMSAAEVSRAEAESRSIAESQSVSEAESESLAEAAKEEQNSLRSRILLIIFIVLLILVLVILITIRSRWISQNTKRRRRKRR